MKKRDLPPVHPGEILSDAQSWMNLQAGYDLEVAEISLAERIEREVKPLQNAA